MSAAAMRWARSDQCPSDTRYMGSALSARAFRYNGSRSTTLDVRAGELEEKPPQLRSDDAVPGGAAGEFVSVHFNDPWHRHQQQVDVLPLQPLGDAPKRSPRRPLPCPLGLVIPDDQAAGRGRVFVDGGV